MLLSIRWGQKCESWPISEAGGGPKSPKENRSSEPAGREGRYNDSVFIHNQTGRLHTSSEEIPVQQDRVPRVRGPHAFP